MMTTDRGIRMVQINIAIQELRDELYQLKADMYLEGMAARLRVDPVADVINEFWQIAGWVACMSSPTQRNKYIMEVAEMVGKPYDYVTERFTSYCNATVSVPVRAQFEHG